MEQRARTTAGLWDVTTWAFGSPLPYRINSLYRLDRAVVTVTGLMQTPDAAADLGATLHVFDLLPVPVFVDLCHARIDGRAARAVVEAGRRRERQGRPGVQVQHADRTTRRVLARADDAWAPPPVQPWVPTPAVTHR